VVRSAGSLGACDLWAARAGNTLTHIECKLSGRIDPKEREALIALADATGGRAVVAMRPRGGRVALLAVLRGTSRLVPLDTLRVPARKPRELVP
jgi:Holliday junction resolvase